MIASTARIGLINNGKYIVILSRRWETGRELNDIESWEFEFSLQCWCAHWVQDEVSPIVWMHKTTLRTTLHIDKTQSITRSLTQLTYHFCTNQDNVTTSDGEHHRLIAKGMNYKNSNTHMTSQWHHAQSGINSNQCLVTIAGRNPTVRRMSYRMKEMIRQQPNFIKQKRHQLNKTIYSWILLGDTNTQVMHDYIHIMTHTHTHSQFNVLAAFLHFS